MGLELVGRWTVLAHPGHGSIPADSPAHQLEPQHAVWILPVLALVAAAWLGGRHYLQRRKLQPLAVRKRPR